MRYRLGCLIFVALCVMAIGFAGACLLVIAAYQIVTQRFVALLLLLLFTASRAHEPPIAGVAPHPDQVVLPSYVDGSTPFCVEHPHMNSHFDTPVARGPLVCALTVDDVRKWIASLKALD